MRTPDFVADLSKFADYAAGSGQWFFSKYPIKLMDLVDLVIVKNVRKRLEGKPTEKLRKIYDKKRPWAIAEEFVAIHQILVERGETVANLPERIQDAYEG